MADPKLLGFGFEIKPPPTPPILKGFGFQVVGLFIPTDPTPTVDFCDVTVRLSEAIAGIKIDARTDVRSYFLADVPINAASAKAHNPDRTVRAVTDVNGIAVLNLPTINNRRTGQAQDSWTINIDAIKYSRRIQVPDQASAELADITID